MTRHAGVRARTIVIISTVVLAVLLLASSVSADGGAASTVPYEVVAGDTLWSIAASETGPETDIRSHVTEIRRLNGLEGSTIVAGQVLRVPDG